MEGHNPNKVAIAGSNSLCITYVDTNKHHWIYYDEDKPLREIQLKGNTHKGVQYQQKGEDLNATQARLYHMALYGVAALEKDEQEKLTPFRRLLITMKHERNQRLINRWKQQLVSYSVDSLLERLWPKSPIFKKMRDPRYSEYTTDKDVFKMSFRTLGVDRVVIIDQMLQWGILPSNFYELK